MLTGQGEGQLLLPVPVEVPPPQLRGLICPQVGVPVKGKVGELLSGAGVAVSAAPQAEARTPEYYRKRPCPDLVYDAAEILEQICAERGRIS